MVSHVRTSDRDEQRRAIQTLEVSITRLPPSDPPLSLSHNNELRTNDVILQRLCRCFKWGALENQMGFKVMSAQFSVRVVCVMFKTFRGCLFLNHTFSFDFIITVKTLYLFPIPGAL